MVHLNIHSVWNKSEVLTYSIDKNIGLPLISVTKLDDSLSTAQFQTEGFSVPCRYDKNRKVSGLLWYIREDIQMKWCLIYSYNPHQNLIPNHLECLNRLIDEHSNSFDNFIFIGDFKVSTNHNSMINFCDLNGLRKIPICYKNSDNPTSINLILTNRSRYFQHSTVFETGLSDFHLLV